VRILSNGQAVLLGLASFHGCEDWPLNAMALFPYNGNQMRLLSSMLARFQLTPYRDDARGPTHPVCLIQTCVSSCPSAYNRNLFRAIGSTFLNKERMSASDCRELLPKLQAWICGPHDNGGWNAYFIDAQSFTRFKDVRLA